jgi:cytochrome b
LKNKAVWDLPVRLLHWTLAATLVAAWWTSSRPGPAHELIGYGAAALIVMRLVWGFTGNRYARFAHFLRAPLVARDYLKAVLHQRAPRHIGHNPLGGWMVVSLLACVGALALTGWALGTDLLWGYGWPVRVHGAIAWLLVGLVVLHIGGVLWTSWQHRENLIVAMFSGKKASPRADDID